MAWTPLEINEDHAAGATKTGPLVGRGTWRCLGLHAEDVSQGYSQKGRASHAQQFPAGHAVTGRLVVPSRYYEHSQASGRFGVTMAGGLGEVSSILCIPAGI